MDNKYHFFLKTDEAAKHFQTLASIPIFWGLSLANPLHHRPDLRRGCISRKYWGMSNTSRLESYPRSP